MMCEGGFNQANCKLTAVIATMNLIVSSILGRKLPASALEEALV